MAAPDEPAVESESTTSPAASVTDRLAGFMLARWPGDDFTHGVGAEEAALDTLKVLAGDVLRDFFRVDVDATSIYAIPGVDVETLDGFSMVHWGPMAGRLGPDELRAIGVAFLEVAEAAEFDSAMMRWLLRDPGASREGAAKILSSFRTFRAELDVAEEPLTEPAA